MTHSLHFWLRLFLLFLGFLGILSSLIYLDRVSILENIRVKETFRKILMWARREKPAKYLSRWVCLIFGFVLGLMYDDLTQYYHIKVETAVQQLIATETRWDFFIVKRYDAHSFGIKFDCSRLQCSEGDTEIKKWKLCLDTNVDWQPGEEVKKATYEQRVGCKSFNGIHLGFDMYTDDPTGQRVVSQLAER